MTSSQTSEAQRFEVRVREPELAGRVIAEAWAAGAVGIEERQPGGDTGPGAMAVLVVYHEAENAAALRLALAGFESEGVLAGPSEPVPQVDWTQAWKQGLEAIEISDRLVVRPSFVAHAGPLGQQELVVDPGQAFGTGGHASTLLALQWIDSLLAETGGRADLARLLDVGTGTGVLALAALRLGAREAVAFDLDPLAVEEARVWAERNGLARRLRLFTGPIAALAGDPFDWVVANLLRKEVLPIAEEITAAVRPGGSVVLSGLLDSDRSQIHDAFGRLGLEPVAERTLYDDNGDCWISPHLRRAT
jgi:ribosomal protein L11 methyltransferase